MAAQAETQDRDKTNAITIRLAGVERVFDIDNPALPDWVDKKSLTAGGYPYDKKLDADIYEDRLEALQIELVKLQAWMQKTGSRVKAASSSGRPKPSCWLGSNSASARR